MVTSLSASAAAALALLSALPWASAASVVAARQSTGDGQCRDVHVFLARGNNEPYPGRQGKLVTAICDGLASCDYEDIQFWNPLEAPYCQSVEEGAANGTAQITAYNKRCPDSKLVVSGYSQGGHVVGDVLGGGGGTFFQNCVQKPNAGLDATKAPGNKISAVLIFGDVRHTESQPYNILSGASHQGLFPRPSNQLAGMMAYSKMMRSYCVDSDPICAGGNTVANHLNYFDLYSVDAGKWVQQIIGETPTSGTSSSAKPPPPTTTTSAASKPATTSTTTSTSTEADAPTDPTPSADADPPPAPPPVSNPASPTTVNSEASSSTPTASGAAGAPAGSAMLLGVAAVAVAGFMTVL